MGRSLAGHRGQRVIATPALPPPYSGDLAMIERESSARGSIKSAAKRAGCRKPAGKRRGGGVQGRERLMVREEGGGGEVEWMYRSKRRNGFF